MEIKEDKIYIMITGATGFIGYLLVRRIMEQNSEQNICLVLPVRDVKRAKERFKETLNSQKEVMWIETALETMDIEEINLPIDYIIHCACVTGSSEMIEHPVEVADGIVLGTKSVLELARKKQVKSMVYLSSMEVYGNVKDIGRPREEGELGEISLENPRSCYPVAKRMAEHYCHLYYSQYGVPVKVARLSQVFGRGVRLNDNRVFMQFARAVRNSKDIVLHTDGSSMGNYCESGDAVKGILTILDKGADGETYNVVNEENTMRIREMAQLVAERIAEGRIKVIYDIPEGNPFGYGVTTELKLSSQKLRKLGWKPHKDMEVMYRELLAWIEENEYE